MSDDDNYEFSFGSNFTEVYDEEDGWLFWSSWGLYRWVKPSYASVGTDPTFQCSWYQLVFVKSLYMCFFFFFNFISKTTFSCGPKLYYFYVLYGLSLNWLWIPIPR
jgi:hypothetical protein